MFLAGWAREFVVSHPALLADKNDGGLTFGGTRSVSVQQILALFASQPSETLLSSRSELVAIGMP
jgi:hypothetical protein